MRKHPTAILDVLFGPEVGGRFTTSHWPLTPVWHHGGRERLAALFDLPCFRSTEDLLRLQVEKVNVQANVGGSRTLQTFEGKGGLAGGQRQALMALYEAGFQLYFHELEDLPGPLEELCVELAAAFGLGRASIGLNAFACVAASPHPPTLHFDPSASVLLQLSGSKRWTIAPNELFPFPTFNHLFGTSIPASHRDEVEADYPREIPAGTEVVLQPGSAMFVPPGMWHCARPVSTSLHLDFNIKAPTVANQLPAWIQTRLRRSVALRRPISDLTSEEEVDTILAEARAELRRLAGSLDAQALVRADILPPRRWPHRYRRDPAVRLQLDGRRMLLQIDDEEGEITVPAELLPVAGWICEGSGDATFGMTELAVLYESREVLDLLEVLEEMGAIRREPAPRRSGAAARVIRRKA